MAEGTPTCVSAVLQAAVALIIALDRCEVLSDFAITLRDDLIALREELEFMTDQGAEE